MKSIILTVVFISAGIAFCVVGFLFKSGKILDTQIGKISGIFALVVGGLTIACGIIIAILPALTDILALVYVVVITIVLCSMIAITSKKTDNTKD